MAAGSLPTKSWSSTCDLLFRSKNQVDLENVDGVRAAAEESEAVFGNIDTWVIGG